VCVSGVYAAFLLWAIAQERRESEFTTSTSRLISFIPFDPQFPSLSLPSATVFDSNLPNPMARIKAINSLHPSFSTTPKPSPPDPQPSSISSPPRTAMVPSALVHSPPYSVSVS